MPNLGELTFLAVVFFNPTISCKPETVATEQAEVSKPSDPLPSWNDGKTKKAIIDFVEDVTNSDSPNFIPVMDRITTFDNNGTLWSEQPIYFQFFFAMDRVKALRQIILNGKTNNPLKRYCRVICLR